MATNLRNEHEAENKLDTKGEHDGAHNKAIWSGWEYTRISFEENS